MKKFLFSFIMLFLVLQSQVADAQKVNNDGIHKIISIINQRSDSAALEKIYLQNDKPFYGTGDSMWMKVYLFNAADLSASSKSGIVYIEIANEENKVVKRMMMSLFIGLGWGNILLKENEFSQGIYTIRAYTNWMRNFDEHYIFRKQFYIVNPAERNLLINTRANVMEEKESGKATMDFQINTVDHKSLANTDFQLRMMNGNKEWYKDKIRTGYDGSMNFNFAIPAKVDAHNLGITLQVLDKNLDNPVYKIPVILNRPENIDLQFMPEGGYIVSGIEAHVAFKALNENGTGVNVSGAVYNNNGKEIASFQSTHLGIGSFYFKPKQDEIYTAKIRLRGSNESKDYLLPTVQSSGIVLQVINKLENDSLELNIVTTPYIKSAHSLYYLIGQSRGIACYGAVIALKQRVTEMKVSKMLFPTGVARFTLLNMAKQPLNERIVYVDHDDHLRIQVNSDKAYYTTRDSVALDLLVTDKMGQPIAGDFSVLVTDDAQVKNDILKTNSLKSNIFLTSDLKGDVEDPGYYFPTLFTDSIWLHLDNLLLAQGWVNYNWQTVFQPLKPETYLAQQNFNVKGSVTNVFNRPVTNSGIMLYSASPTFTIDTMTNTAGVFNFRNLHPTGKPVYFLQARNKRGKTFNVGIEVDEFKPPVFAAQKTTMTPWYVNIDSNKRKSLNTIVSYKEEWEQKFGVKVLEEVKVTGRKIIKDSKNLNDNGGADLTLNEQDLQKEGRMTLGNLLKKYVEGFHSGSAKSAYRYFIKNRYCHIIIDGVDIDWIALHSYDDIEYQRFVDEMLNSFTAEDIKGIEVMSSSKYAGVYVLRLLGKDSLPFDHAFIEVTTYEGRGPFFPESTPGVYLYRPLAFCPQTQFYSPKYTSKYDSSILDTRSTIYWEPNIIADKNGKANLSFYTADHPGTYTLLIEGSDMSGNVESTTKKIIVK